MSAARVDGALGRELRRIEKDRVIEPGEIVEEIELAIEDEFPGTLVLTSRRLLFHTTMFRGRSTRLISIPLADISSVDATSARWFFRARGKLLVSHGEQRHEFRRIDSVHRAETFADAIRRLCALSGGPV